MADCEFHRDVHSGLACSLDISLEHVVKILRRTDFISEAKEKTGETVVVSGWVHDVRILGGINFVLLRDRSGIIQVTILKAKSSKEIVNLVSKLHQEDVIS